MKKIFKRSFAITLSLYILVVTAVLCSVSFYLYYNSVYSMMLGDLSKRSELRVKNLSYSIDSIFMETRRTIDAMNTFASDLDVTDINAQKLLTRVVSHSRDIVGASIAVSPEVNRGKRTMKYMMQDSLGNLSYKSFSDTSSYYYLDKDWFVKPLKSGKPMWSEPYFDEGAGNISMITYSYPLERDSVKYGVLTADLSLDKMYSYLNNIQDEQGMNILLVTKDGDYLYVKNKNQTTRMDDESRKRARHIIDSLHRSPQQGYDYGYDGKDHFYLYNRLEATGWGVCICTTKELVFAELNKVTHNVILIIVICLLLISITVIFIVKRSTRSLKVLSNSASKIAAGDFDSPIERQNSSIEFSNLSDAFVNMQCSLKEYIAEIEATTREKERTESDLKIARDIQLGMLPHLDILAGIAGKIDVGALLKSARQVGGDLYDFAVFGDKLYFTVGDVSGKGTPASLFMAITATLFRSVIQRFDEPSDILSNINDALYSQNDAELFVTMFVGVLDTKTLELKFASAGHNPPVIVNDSEPQFLKAAVNLPLGLFEDYHFESHSITLNSNSSILVYSDGLTEAENNNSELYSESRLLDFMKQNKKPQSAQSLIDSLHESVVNHANGTPQSDDLTMLYLTLKN